ncbi:hypothetical protein QBC34DRAFT_472428, partial [Podospora aff. communis PSN243]
QYSCPYRKRNPLRFNIRDWEYCSKAPFRSIVEMKKHVVRFHQRREVLYQCARCHAKFAGPEDHALHMRQDLANMCQLKDREESDVDTEETLSMAAADKLRINRSKYSTWVDVWRVLFPNDHVEDIPAPAFEPPVELHEVMREYEEGLPHLQGFLTEAMLGSAPRGTSSSVGSTAYPSFTPELVQLAVGKFMAGVFQRARITAVFIDKRGEIWLLEKLVCKLSEKPGLKFLPAKFRSPKLISKIKPREFSQLQRQPCREYQRRNNK